MTHTRRWVLASSAVAGLLAVAWLVVWAIVPDDDALARRLEAEFETRLGQKLVVGAVHWRLLGLPRVEVLDAHTGQAEAIRVRRIAVYPELLPLLRQRVVIHRLEIDGAVVPRSALAAYRNKPQVGLGPVVLRALVFTDTTYIDHGGIALVYEGDIGFDADGLPRRVQVRRSGVSPPVSLDATRDGKTDSGADRYQLRLQGAGGSANGQAQFALAARVLTGELAPRNVEVTALMAAFGRRSPISGLASGQTVLRAEGDSLNSLVRSLTTRSVMQVEGAKVLRFNLEKAVRSVGKDSEGETALDSLAGVIETHNTEQGLKAGFTRVKAVAGPYTGTGRATVYRRQIDAQGTLAVGGGVLEVPFSLRGPTRDPEFQIAWGTLAGAAVGTAVLPGIGTVIGAKIGGMFSGPPQAPDAPAPVKPPRR
jgi:AsmA-like C-terminal region